ncbi:uncharacterized protein LOC110414605 [Herrania umbratica]|uniref:Uncharacterized protein LOC110414605 n=1 Tax=Herrania umbratica TaxID=108875 RepID=A0A6J1A465_9ROSI|nr:uncharacterized protein LOC110414605 [Herrania umbratica]
MTMTLGRNNMSMNLATTTTKLTCQTLGNPSKECSNCGVHVPYFLHQVRLLGIQRRLCTSCVLRLHPSSFCPACFAFYGGTLPHPSKRIACSNCSSFTHSHCAGDNLLSSYLCPPCKDSSFSFFPLKDNKIDKKLALALLCAAKIASSSMGKALTVAWTEADRKVREAALARKRAREALEHLLHITREERARKKENENVSADLSDANLAKVEDLDLDMDTGDGDGDGDIDLDLVRQLEDSLVKDEDIDCKFN